MLASLCSHIKRDDGLNIDQMDSVHQLGRCEENKTRYVIIKFTRGTHLNTPRYTILYYILSQNRLGSLIKYL